MNRTRRAISTAGIGGAAALLAAAGGASWYYASRVTEPAADARPRPPAVDDHVRVVHAELSPDGCTGRVWLQGPDAARPGTWGVAIPDGYAQVGDVVDVSGGKVERPVLVIRGRLHAGTDGILDGHAWPSDPRVLGLVWRHTTFASPVGDFPAWEFDPPVDAPASDTWAIYVHGRSAHRHEAFRTVPVVAALGVTSLVISYRNDVGAPRSPDGHTHLGGTEWEEVEAAVIHARSRGARDVIVIGYSMGGAVVSRFLAVSAQATHVRAVILEAPVLDWAPVLRMAARERGLPPAVIPWLMPATMALAKARAGIDWRSLDQLGDTSVMRHPTLLIHGDADEIVPVELADTLAAARPDLVTYLRVPGAGHVRAWNTDRPRVEAAITAFLGLHLEDTGGSRGRRTRRR